MYETPEHSARGVETLRVSITPDTAQNGTDLDEVLSEEDLDADVAVNAVDRAGSRSRGIAVALQLAGQTSCTTGETPKRQ